ncbi:hypothetical protein IW137_001669 [Coemansia sp. RSA 1287]|nr:hypothetical protein LPJ54_004082 [Coemansia sp. RSA 1824]KAJ2645877.1 hypothetical protein IW137_001669 [Coemansia sp. RSA 1287]
MGITILEKQMAEQEDIFVSMFKSLMTTLSNWEEEGMVEDILVKIGYLDLFAPELTSSLIKWHIEGL